MIMNFVRTEDEKIADELRRNGFQELKKDGSFFVFINEKTDRAVTGFAESGKVVFTNQLNI